MGNIPSYLRFALANALQPPSVFTQCIRKRKTSHSQQLIDIDSDSDSDFDDEKIIFYNRKDDSLKKKKLPQAVRNNYEMMGVNYW